MFQLQRAGKCRESKRETQKGRERKEESGYWRKQAQKDQSRTAKALHAMQQADCWTAVSCSTPLSSCWSAVHVQSSPHSPAALELTWHGTFLSMDLRRWLPSPRMGRGDQTFPIPTHESKLNYSWAAPTFLTSSGTNMQSKTQGRTLELGCQEVGMRWKLKESFLPLYLGKGRTGLKVVDSLRKDGKTLPWNCLLWRRGWSSWDGNPWPGAILLLLSTCLAKLSVTDGLLHRETSCLSVTPQTPALGLWKCRASWIWGCQCFPYHGHSKWSLRRKNHWCCLLQCRQLLNLNLCGHYQITCIWTSFPR